MERSFRETLARLREVPRTVRKVRSLRAYVSKPNPKIREYIARVYLRGDGIEIGALHSALRLPADASALYVDRMSLQELRDEYPQLDATAVMPPDIIDDGERLAGLSDDTQDFVVANHFIEHCEDPIQAIENILRVLKPGGVAYLAIPDKRFTFDVSREVTPIEHLKRDYEFGGATSRVEHFRDWSRHVEGALDTEVESVASALMAKNYSIHYHVWTQIELLELIATLRREYHLPFELELFFVNDNECVIVLRKIASERA